MELKLRGKKAFITGGSKGIGLAVARGFAEEGVDVAIGARNGDTVEKEADRIRGDYGVAACGIMMDVTKPDDILSARDLIVERFGGIDVLVNNAGTGSEETIMGSPDEKWYRFWDLHVMAAIRTARAFVPIMQMRGGGVILNTASICASQPLWYEPIYNTTKAALVMLTKCLANEVIADNIRVNTVSPGLVLTPDWRKTAGILGAKEGITTDEYLDRVAHENAPIGRFATPEEVAHLYVFLASPQASYCVGSTYYIDGGWLKVTT
jgi:NAD(P)-dependent dehydrogenase (short-subunit alcohol dehydrogenase family)